MSGAGDGVNGAFDFWLTGRSKIGRCAARSSPRSSTLRAASEWPRTCTQLEFQFGGAEHVESQLRELAAAEGARTGSDAPSEVFAVLRKAR